MAFFLGGAVAFFLVALDLPFLVAVVGGTGLVDGMLDMMNAESGEDSDCRFLALAWDY